VVFSFYVKENNLIIVIKVYYKGDDIMAVYAIKSKTPFITSKKELKGKRPSEEYLERRRYINSHNFIFDTDEETGELKVIITEKEIEEC